MTCIVSIDYNVPMYDMIHIKDLLKIITINYNLL